MDKVKGAIAQMDLLIVHDHLIERARSRRSISARLAARCSLVPKKRRSLPPGCRIAMSVPFGTSLSMRRSIIAVVSNGTPALVGGARFGFAPIDIVLNTEQMCAPLWRGIVRHRTVDHGGDAIEH